MPIGVQDFSMRLSYQFLKVDSIGSAGQLTVSLVVENCYVVLYNSCVKILRMNKGMRLKGRRNYGKRDNERCAVLGAEGRGGH